MAKRTEKNMTIALLSSLLKYLCFTDMENLWMPPHTQKKKGLIVTDLWRFLLIRHLVEYRTDFLEKNTLNHK